MFAVCCDNCKAKFFDNHDYSCLSEENMVRDDMNEILWLITDEDSDEEKHYCNACWSYGDEDEILINTSRTK